MVTENLLIDDIRDDCTKKTKRKTNFAEIIVSGTAEKPYYSIMWFNYTDNQYHVGYGSYNLHFVFQWLSECFEIEDAPTAEAAEVVRCKECKWRREWLSGGTFYCCNPNYGMASGVELMDDDFCSYGERKDDA